jgi:GNAT superfamily N-acetyltransferase
MPFRLEVAQPHDAPRIAQIHMDAFSSNALICAIHAADKGLRDLRKAVEKKVLADMEDVKTTVLIVRYISEGAAASENDVAIESSSNSDVIGFAKWTHPIYPGENCVPPSWNLPESTDPRVLGPWRVQVEKVEKAIIGQTPRYGQYLYPNLVSLQSSDNLTLPPELTYLAVDARYARQGAGRMIVQWALDLCEAEGCLAYVESTVEAVPFYEKMGFVAAGSISLDIAGMRGQGGVEVYQEIGCIYRPKCGEGLSERSRSLSTIGIV